MSVDRQAGLRGAREAAAWLRSHMSTGGRLRADSRQVTSGDAFIATAGQQHDGRAFIDEAVRQGAAVILYEADGAAVGAQDAVKMNAFHGLREAAGAIASAFYGEPSRRLRVVGFTGTNGKTSCANWCAAGLTDMGVTSAAIGTLGLSRFDRAAGRAQIDAALGGLTTPDAVALQDSLAILVAENVDTVALEASSIGLTQGRLDGCQFHIAVFTNLSRDHLDFHGDMNSYSAAKARLFQSEALQAAIVNGDDPAAAIMLNHVHAQPRVTVFGEAPSVPAGAAQIRITKALADGSGSSVHVEGDFGSENFHVPVPGRFNVDNAVAVIAVWLHLGFDLAQACEQIARVQAVPGRLQRVGTALNPMVLVDYAHTPEAVIAVLRAVRANARARDGRLWCVLGCGGDRDAGKRPLMAAAAEQGADHVVLTSDNPRSESPAAIIAQMRTGLGQPPWGEYLDRAEAIAAVIDHAASTDVVVIAGKGHEQYQEVGDQRLPFSDVDVAARYLAKKSGSLH